MTRLATTCCSIVATLALMSGCDDSDRAPGMIEISIYGEEFIEQGIPAEAFADDWSVTFDKFLVSAGNIQLAEEFDIAPALSLEDYYIIDLTAPSGGAGHVLVTREVAGGDYHAVSYRVAPSADATATGNVSQEDVALMTQNGYAMYVEGSATQGAITKTFAWKFSTATRYGACEANALIDGNTARPELTIHADHLFYDDLISDEPNVVFDALADADADGDNQITEAELLAVDIRGFERYQVGSFPVTDLWTYLDYQASTVGHIDGEGHCDSAERE